MRWFTDAARADHGDAWERAAADYSTHLSAIVRSLPADLTRLATDPRLDLKDGRFREVSIDQIEETVTIQVHCGDLQVGYRRLSLHFAGAADIPGDLSLLADAIGAHFRPSRWHTRQTVTEIRAQEVDIAGDGRYVLRLRLWPFHEFAVEFSDLRVEEKPLQELGPIRRGTFTIRTAD